MNKIVGDVIFPSESGWHQTEYFVVPFVKNDKNETNLNITFKSENEKGYSNGFTIHRK